MEELDRKSSARGILDRLMSYTWVIQSIYWKYADQVVYDQDKQRAKKILHDVYGFKDIYELLPAEVDDVKLMDHVRTLMSIDIMQNPEATGVMTKIDNKNL